MNKEDLNKLSKIIIGIAIDIHKILGPGFFEKIYAKALIHELNVHKIFYTNERVIKVKYKDLLLGNQRLDFLIENALVLELKVVPEINDAH